MPLPVTFPPAVPPRVSETPEANPAPRTHAADLQPIVARAVRSHSGLGAAPDLLSDWHEAVVEAEVHLQASLRIEPQVAAALQKEELRLGRQLTRSETRAAADPVVKALLPAAVALVRPGLAGSDSLKQATEVLVLARELPNVAQHPDPFMPIALSSQARANERVVWESNEVMVLVDTFAPGPKVLVIPKTPMSLPTQATKGQLAELARVAATTSEVFRQLGAPRPASIWINPPQHLLVRQLHVHVHPRMGGWGTDDKAVAQARATKLYDALEKALQGLLGPTTPPP